MKRRILFVLLALTLAISLMACSKQPDAPPANSNTNSNSNQQQTPENPVPEQPPASSDVTLNIMTNMTGGANDVFGKVCEEFTAETGIKVDYAAPANEYEPMLKTKMATNDLPDVWSTHGWAVARYSSFLRPLNDQPWVDKISPLIKPMITGPEGNVYVIPVDMDIAGIVYNRDILAEVNISVDSIKTWRDFENACEAVKNAGYIPVYLGGSDDWTIGQFFDWVAPSFFITNDRSNDRDTLINGTFDWSKWIPLAQMFRSWNEAGYFNVDCTTSDYDTTTRELGQGNVAFAFFGNYAAADAALAGSANIGMMWIPSSDASDEPSLIAGERLAVGVWKDTPHEAEALAFINFLARPDVMKRLAESNGMPAGFIGVDVDTGNVAQDYAKYVNVRTFPYFDRVYLPGGMWDDFCNTGIGILNGSMSNDDVVGIMEASYKEKMG